MTVTTHVGSLTRTFVAVAPPSKAVNRIAPNTEVRGMRYTIAQINSINVRLSVAVERWNNANVKLQRIQSDLRRSKHELGIAKVNLKRAQTELGWQPRVSLREGLERTIAYFDRLLSGEPRVRKVVRKNTARAISAAPLTSVEDSAIRMNNVQR